MKTKTQAGGPGLRENSHKLPLPILLECPPCSNDIQPCNGCFWLRLCRASRSDSDRHLVFVDLRRIAKQFLRGAV